MNFEDSLASLRPADPTPGLKVRVRADLGARGTGPWRMLAAWLIPSAAAACLAAAALASISRPDARGGMMLTRREFPVFSSSQLVFSRDAQPLRVSAVGSLVLTNWRDPATGQRIVRMEPQMSLTYRNLEIQ